MRKLAALGLAMVASVLLFMAIFTVVERPLTIGGVATTFAARKAYADSLPSPRLLIWAGSNGRYSHRCATLTEVTGLPCANLSVAMGIGLDFQMAQYEPLLRAGDILYMPFEYSQFRVERAEMESGAENAALVHDMPGVLWRLEPRRIAAAYGYFDLKYFVNAVLEMGLARLGVRQRAGSTVGASEQGDVTGHTAEQAVAYKSYVASMNFDKLPIPNDTYALRLIVAFLQRAHDRGVLVVGGLPTLPDHDKVDQAFIGRWRTLLEHRGHRLLVLENRSQYPLACFYDTLYHLNEECQIQHSQRVGRELASLLAGHAALQP
jgi:hypothetical protein